MVVWICLCRVTSSLIPITRRLRGKNGVPPSSCEFRGVNVFCGPLGLVGEKDHLFHNNGDGTFTEVSAKAGVSDSNGAYGWSSVFVDVDDDGWLDLLVANDSVPNFLYRNNHDGTFKDDSYMSGAGFERRRSRPSLHGNCCRRRLQSRWQGRFSPHHILQRLQTSVPKRRQWGIQRRYGTSWPPAADHSLSGMGHRVSRFRQRWLVGHLFCKRPRIRSGRRI